MTRRSIAPEIAHLVDAPLSEQEFLERVRRPPTAEEIAEVRELVRWFTRRYPTVGERLGYVRRAYARWNRRLPVVVRRGG